MMMRILEAGGLPVLTDGERAADIDNPNGYYEFEPVKTTATDSSWLAQADGRVVKMIYKLLPDLPDDHTYHVVFMQRALKEVAASQNTMLVRRGLSPSGPSDAHALVGTFAAEVATIKTWLRAQPNFRVLYVNYNHLLAAPHDHLPAVTDFLGGRLDEVAMARVIDPVLYRQH